MSSRFALARAIGPLRNNNVSKSAFLMRGNFVRSFHGSQMQNALSKFLMPAMSPTMTEGGIATWKKQAGESFSAGDVLLEIETDKATMDVEAQDDGIMAKIVIDAGAKNVQVNSLIAIIGEEGDDISGADALAKEAESAPAPAKEESSEKKEEEKSSSQPPSESKSSSSEPPAPQPSSSSSSSSSSDRVFASPLARRLAQDKGYPLAQIKGTGPNGRIVKADIDNYKPSSAPAQASAGGASSSSSAKAPASAPASEQASSSYSDIPVSNMRKVIGSRLTESKQQVPHYYVSIDVEMDKVIKLRQLFNEAAERQAGGDAQKAKEAKLSVGDFITKAAAIALRQVPDVNAAWYGDFIRQFNTADISIAVATPTGLITPIVKDVGKIGLTTISSQTKSLASKARQGKLQPQEYQGGSFTISNMGMFGITHFTAIINQPQGAILAIGGTEPKLIVDESEEKGFRKAMVMQATISADHRIIDGATAAKWMKAFKDALENPLSFML